MSFFDPFSRFSWIPMIFRDSPGFTAQIDWIEAPNNHIFKINVPGLSRDEIKVQLEEGNVLQISSKGAKEESSPKDENVFLKTMSSKVYGHIQEI